MTIKEIRMMNCIFFNMPYKNSIEEDKTYIEETLDNCKLASNYRFSDQETKHDFKSKIKKVLKNVKKIIEQLSSEANTLEERKYCKNYTTKI